MPPSAYGRPRSAPGRSASDDAAPYSDDPEWLELAFRQGVNPQTWHLAEPAADELTATYRKTGFVPALNRHFVGPDNRVYLRSPETEPDQAARDRLGREAGSAQFGTGSRVETVTGIPEGGFKIGAKHGGAMAPDLPGGSIKVPRPAPRGDRAAGETTEATVNAEKPAPGRNSISEAHRMTNRWPELRMSADRQRSILENTPAYFPIADDPNANSDTPSYANLKVATETVAKLDPIIEEEAERAGVDPDLVRAIMYVERSQGHYYGAGPVLDFTGASRTILPMNINPYIWGPLVNDGKNFRFVVTPLAHPYDEAHKRFENPQINIRAAAILLKRISERLDDPTPAKVGSLYNSLAKEKVTDYGARVERVYRTREWEKLQP